MKKIRANLERELTSGWCRMKVVAPSRADTREMWGELTDRYDLHVAYERAHARKDPFLAPHGFFRRLAPGNNRHAREFLEKFGPLTLDVGKRLLGNGAGVRVDLNEFWGLHLRFSLLSELWESLHDRGRLAKALLDIYRRRTEVSKWGKFSAHNSVHRPPTGNPGTSFLGSTKERERKHG